MNSYTRKKVTYELVTHDYLYEEPANLLEQELREPAIYNAIIKAIAEGASRLNNITMEVGEDNSVVSKYLKTLALPKKRLRSQRSLERKQSICWQITSSGSGIALSQSM